jgi:hypothetical protein
VASPYDPAAQEGTEDGAEVGRAECKMTVDIVDKTGVDIVIYFISVQMIIVFNIYCV